MTQASHTHGYTNTRVAVHKHSCSLYLSHTHMCVRTLVQNKAGCLLFTGCGNRFASMPSLSHEGGEEYRKRCSTVQQRDLPSIKNQLRKISTHTDVAVVHLLHACCTNAEQLRNPRRNCSRRERCRGGERLLSSTRPLITVFAQFFMFVHKLKHNALQASCRKVITLHSFISRQAQTKFLPGT